MTPVFPANGVHIVYLQKSNNCHIKAPIYIFKLLKSVQFYSLPLQ